jgi:hypothetical protein
MWSSCTNHPQPSVCTWLSREHGAESPLCRYFWLETQLQRSLRVTTRSKSLSKMMRKIPDDPIGSDWLSSCNSALTLRAFKMSKIKNLKRSNFGQSVFLRAQNALCGKTGGAIIRPLVSKQDGMVFSSSPTLLCLVRVNPPIPTRF